MKKFWAYLLLLILIIISLSACRPKDTPAEEEPVGPKIIGAQIIANAGDAKVKLDWLMVPDTETYNIYYIEGTDSKPSSTEMKAGSKFTISSGMTEVSALSDLPLTQTNGVVAGLVSAPLTVTNLKNGTKYWFAFSAVNADAESALSTIISATPSDSPPPATPQNVRANAGNEKVTVTWNPVADATSYNLYCTWTTGTDYGSGSITIPGQASNSKVVDSIYWSAGTGEGTTTGLTNEKVYIFYLTAVNATAVEGNPSFMVYAVPSENPPPAAPVLETPAVVGSNVTLTWNVVTATPAVTSYNVYVGTAKGVTKGTGVPSSVSVITNPMTTTATLSTGKYYFVVTAVNANGKESAESNEMSALVP
ncbi:MAG: hypothetical protein NTW65_11375 [Deltaproteobacteria bacterium]|nr:hypothetical protein [Deltaproteobacteria bacterium]